jgi:hypothetical protein
MKRAKGFRCREHQEAERPCEPARCHTMAEAQSLQDRIEAVCHLASAGRDETLGADGLSPSAALQAIETLAFSIIAGDEWTTRLPGEEYVKWAPITPDEEELEPESGRGRRAAKPSRVPKAVPGAPPDQPKESPLQ